MKGPGLGAAGDATKISIKTNSEMKKQEVQLAAKKSIEGDTQHTQSRIAGYIKRTWERNRRARLNIDDILIYCLQARKGMYSPTELGAIISNGGADPVYLKLTGTKCRAASSWIRDIILPAGERPWSLERTSEPTLPKTLETAVEIHAKQEIQQLIQEGILQDTSEAIGFMGMVREHARKAINKMADDAADRMETRISDKMDEGNWDNAIEEFIEDFVTYPAAFLKGPYLRKRKKLEWGQDFEPLVKEEVVPYWTRVSPFDIYPAPHARNLKEYDLIERIRFTRDSLYGLIGMPSYKEKEIREAIDCYDGGKLSEWIWEDFERNRLESDSSYFTSQADTIDGLHYWGPVLGKLLKEWGAIGNIDEQKTYEVDAILIGNNVIRAEVNDDPMGNRPYHFACWDPIPSAIWGMALPIQMEDHQKIVNSCARALCDNMALSSGPQVVVMTNQVPAGEDITTIFPFKIWQMKSDPLAPASNRPVDFFQPDMNATTLLSVLDAFEQRADDVTNVPRYSYGNQRVGGAGSTASGLSMLLNSAAKGIRRAIAHIDANVIRPTVYQTFIWVMLNDPDVTIKGDCAVVPRGATALLIKDQSQVRVQTFLAQTANPIDMQIIGMKGRAALLRENAKLLDLPVDDIVPTDEEIMQQSAQQQAQAQQQQQQEQMMNGAPGAPQGGVPAAPEAPSDQAQLMGNQSQIMQNKITGTGQRAQ